MDEVDEATAEAEFDSLVSSNGYDRNLKVKGVSRITKWGKIMRKFWIDEFPQFFINVVWNQDMAIVGVRPHTRKQWRVHPEGHLRDRALNYRPGLGGYQYSDTGWDMEEYLDRKDKSPILTDRECFCGIVRNVLKKGFMSS